MPYVLAFLNMEQVNNSVVFVVSVTRILFTKIGRLKMTDYQMKHKTD